MRVHTKDLRTESTLIRDVYNEFGTLLFPAGHKLNRGDITVLRRNSIHSVVIAHSHAEIKNEEQMLEFYLQAVGSMSSILNEVRDGRKIRLDDFREIALPLVRYIYDTPAIPAELAKVRKIDHYTYEHSIQVGLLSAALGKWLKLSMNEIIDLSIAGFLHDIGKVKIPVSILNKPGRLTKEEMELMKRHAELGYELVRTIPHITKPIADAALYHHERMDGSGYPFGLRDKEIPFFARIIMVADVYDAMTSSRVYQRSSSPFHAFETIFNEQFGRLDAFISRTFLDNIVHSYIGTEVRLSNGHTGEVVFIGPEAPGRPTIRTQQDFINLKEMKEIAIEEMIYA